MEKNNLKITNAWCMYDWANSVYNLVIVSAIFPIYYNAATRSAFAGDRITFFGFEIENTVLYSYSLSLSFIIAAVLSIIFSGPADYGGKKKFFMKIFTRIGAVACMALYFFDGSNPEFGMFAFVLAGTGYSASLVFYNAFLPEISTPDRTDRLSARGFSFGYIGGVILLIVNLIMIEKPAWFFLENGDQAARMSFLTVGVWWIVFSEITFRFVPDLKPKKDSDKNLFTLGFLELREVYRKIRQMANVKKYLLSFFFYSAGVQTFMYLAATFGEKELKMADDKLIITVLIVQIVAIAGASLFARISDRKGNKFSLLIMLFIWLACCLGAYMVYSDTEFFVLAFVIGCIMGGIQSLSRSTYAKLIPQNTRDTASFFSFYDVTEKLSIVFGTFCYGLTEQLTDNMRNSSLFLGLFFLVGLGILFLVKIPLAKKAGSAS